MVARAKQIVDGWSFSLYTPLITFVVYDPAMLEMMVNFKDGTELTYGDVPYNTALSLQYAADPDNYYQAAIVNSYPLEFEPN